MEAAELLKTSELKQKEIYIFTDLAQPAWASPTTHGCTSGSKSWTAWALHVIDVGVHGSEELRAGGRAAARGPGDRQEQPLRVEVDLSHRGDAGERMVELHLAKTAAEVDAEPTQLVATRRGVQRRS